MNQVASKLILMEGTGLEEEAEEAESENTDIPEDWKEKCPNDLDWCNTFLGKMISQGKQKQLFGDVQPQELTPEEKEKVEAYCSKIDEKKETCIEVKTLAMQLWNAKDKLEEERGAKIDDDNKGSLVVWLVVGGLFVFLLIGGILLYVYLSNDTKDAGGNTKGSKLKSRRSKSGKSNLGKSSRKSRASKISHQSKQTSKNLGSKKSFKPK